MSAHTFKSNKEREDFIKDYRKWGEWFHEPHTEATYYKTNLSKGYTIVVAEHAITRVDWANYRPTQGTNPLTYESVDLSYYLLDPNKHFHDCRASKTALIKFLKDEYSPKEEQAACS